MLRILIVLYELGSMGGLLGLGIGITLALFHVLGKKVVQEVCKINEGFSR
jgi:hypothetical protein